MAQKKITDERYRNVNKRNKKKKSGRGSTIALIVVAILILAAVGVGAWYFWIYQPNQGFTPVTPGKDKPDDVPEAIEKLSDVDGDYARKEGVRNFLVVGKDRVALNTDVIMVVSYDTVNNKVSIMQFPRDTYCEIEGGRYKFNAIYAKFYNDALNMGYSEDDSKVYGVEHLRDTMQNNLSIKIDYYFLINLEGFVNIIDDIGGVSMYVPYDMDYEDYMQDLYIHLRQGVQTLSGKDAEGFVRFRYGYMNADLGRQDAQKLFMTALFEKVKNGDGINITNVGSVVSDIMKNSITNIPTNDFIYMFKKVFDINMDNVVMFSAPGNACMVDGVSYYVISRYDTTRLINKYLNVYSEIPVDDNNFDVNTVFAAEYIDTVNSIYYRETTNDLNTLVYTASGVELSGIDIPLL